MAVESEEQKMVLAGRFANLLYRRYFLKQNVGKYFSDFEMHTGRFTHHEFMMLDEYYKDALLFQVRILICKLMIEDKYFYRAYSPYWKAESEKEKDGIIQEEWEVFNKFEFSALIQEIAALPNTDARASDGKRAELREDLEAHWVEYRDKRAEAMDTLDDYEAFSVLDEEVDDLITLTDTMFKTMDLARRGSFLVAEYGPRCWSYLADHLNKRYIQMNGDNFKFFQIMLRLNQKYQLLQPPKRTHVHNDEQNSGLEPVKSEVERFVKVGESSRRPIQLSCELRYLLMSGTRLTIANYLLNGSEQKLDYIREYFDDAEQERIWTEHERATPEHDYTNPYLCNACLKLFPSSTPIATSHPVTTEPDIPGTFIDELEGKILMMNPKTRQYEYRDPQDVMQQQSDDWENDDVSSRTVSIDWGSSSSDEQPSSPPTKKEPIKQEAITIPISHEERCNGCHLM